MKQINIEEMTAKLNEFVQGHPNKTYTGAELNEALRKLGFNKTVAFRIALNAFPFEKFGVSTLYSTPKKPIYKGLVENAYKYVSSYQRKRKQKIQNPGTNPEAAEKDALKLLSSKGYQIRKCVGLDIEKLRMKYPEVYKACLKYEIV